MNLHQPTDPPRRVNSRITIIRTLAVGFGLFPALAAAQTTATSSTPLPSLARFVPADIRLFVQVDRLPEVGRRHRNRDVWWELLEWSSGDTPSWSATIVDALGVRSQSALIRLFQNHVALAAPEWDRIGDGIIILADADEQTRQRLIHPSRARRVGTIGAATIHRTQTGLWIAIRDNLTLLARTRGKRGLFDDAAGLMDGQRDATLAASAKFITRVNALPHPRDGMVYWTADATAPADSAFARLQPALREGALSIRVQDDSVGLSFLSTPTAESEPSYLPRIVYDRFAALPQTTIAAWATSVDAAELARRIESSDIPKVLTPLSLLAMTEEDTARFRHDVLANLGPRCVAVLGADFESVDLLPQIAVLIESTDAQTAVATLHELAEHVVAASGTEAVREISIESSVYLDVTIHELHWGRERTEVDTDSIASLLGEDLIPSFAAHRDWLVVSTSPKHIRQVVDAANGLSPRLGETVKDPQIVANLQKAVRAAVVQPSYAQSTLRYWESILLDRRHAEAARDRLGARLDPAAYAGQVIVAEVNSNGPSDGVLEPGDGIIACNDTLFRLDSPNEHFDLLLAATALTDPLVVRVRRGESFLDLTYPPDADAVVESRTSLSPLLDRLAPVEILAAQLDVATFTVGRPTGDLYRAELTLMFAAPRDTTPARRPTNAP